ncbi:(2Fe-2S)-binding protein [Hyphomicrobiales bacterium]|nr:(2Fe-2S)-binding protein [Hyphomicrobiales bacterium]CAH1690786.1 (2Fe-2S)-binding protein [Hyphomicrobiales bacterium]
MFDPAYGDHGPDMAPRVAIVGAGPAGIRAAEALVDAGLRPILIDEAPRPGGQIYRQPPPALQRPARELYGFEATKAARLHQTFARIRPAMDYRSETLVWGVRDNRVLLSGSEGRAELYFDRIIVATGAMDRIAPIPGWTQPGVYSLGGAQVMLKYQASLIGRRPIFVGTGPLLYLIAWQYLKAGVRPAAVIETGTFSGLASALPRLAARPQTLLKGVYFSAGLRARNIPIIYSANPADIYVEGESLVLSYSSYGKQAKVIGDAVALGSGLKPETQLAEVLGVAFAFHHPTRLHLPQCDIMGRSNLPHVYIAGDAGGIRGADAAEAGGALAAMAVLKDLGWTINEARRSLLVKHMQRAERFRSGLESAFPYPTRCVTDLPDDAILCRCENITVGAVRTAIPSWQVKDVNRLKAITRCGMGRCQGRLCGSATAELLAAEAGQRIVDIGRMRGQIPLKPLLGQRFAEEVTS